MNKQDQTESEKYLCTLTLAEEMEKLGCRCISTSMERHSWYQEANVQLKRLVLTFAVPTEEKDTLFSIYRVLEKYRENYTKLSKKSKTDWYLTTDTKDIVVTLEEPY